MTEHQVHIRTLTNGLTLLIEPMRDVQSASFALAVPAGCIYEPAGHNGTAAVLCDMITRGAGTRDSRQLSFDLDNLGLQRGESIGWNHLTLSGATIADKLPEALRIYADIVQQPRLPDQEFAPALVGLEQSLRSLEDEPRQKVIVELRKRCYDSPWGRPTDGDLNDLPRLSIDGVREHSAKCVRPNDAILGIAGHIDINAIDQLVDECFGSWESQPVPTIDRSPRGERHGHIEHDSKQTHIGIAYDAVPYRDDDYFTAWAAVSVLSGGSSSRLFTEVRERRGLCYSVYATLNTLKDEGRVLGYAGTTAERAQETLDVTLSEMQRLGEGIEQEELDRCKAQAKSSLIMQQESTGARAGSLIRDWFFLGRVMPLEEVHDKLNAITIDAVLDYVHRKPARDFTILTIGPQPLADSSLRSAGDV